MTGTTTGDSLGESEATQSPASAVWTEFAVPLRAFVRRRVPAAIDADDVVQDIYLRVIRNLPSLEAVEHLDAWVFQIARTAVTDALRAHGRREARTEDVDVDAIEDPVLTVAPNAAAELTPCMVPFIRRLDEPYRTALDLTALRGLTQQEAAAQVGISLSGMKSRVQRAREQVRQLMLRCCDVELDVRGSIVDYDVRDRTVCGPDPASLTPIQRLQR